MFVGTQQRVTINYTHYYVAMVFHNKIFHAYVIIELKAKKWTPEAAGKINKYLNYYASEVEDKYEVAEEIMAKNDNAHSVRMIDSLRKNI